MAPRTSWTLVAVGLLAAAGVPRPALPDPAGDCSKTADTQLAMNRCAERGFHDADKELDRVYARWEAKVEKDLAKAEKDLHENVFPEDAKRLTERRDAVRGRLKALQESQQLFVKYRDVNCTLHGSKFSGGTMEPLEQVTCRANMTKLRTQDLALAFERD